MAQFPSGSFRRPTQSLFAAVIFAASLAAQSPSINLQIGSYPTSPLSYNPAQYIYSTSGNMTLENSAAVLRLTGTSGQWVYPLVNLRAPDVDESSVSPDEMNDEQKVIYHLKNLEVNYDWIFGQKTAWPANSAFVDYAVTGNELVSCTGTMLQVVLSLMGNSTTPELVRSVYQPIHSTSTATTQTYDWNAHPAAWGSNTFAYLWTGMLMNATSSGSDKIFDFHALVEHVLEYQALLGNGDVEHLMLDRDPSQYPSDLPTPADPNAKWSYYELIARHVLFSVDIQFAAVTSCIPSQGYTTPSIIPPVFVPTCPIPTLTFSNTLTVTFGYIGTIGHPNSQRRWAAPILPQPLASSGLIGDAAEVRVSALVSPALITWKDSANVVRSSYMSYSRPGYWSFPVPAGTAAGIGSIVSIDCPSGTIVGNPTRASSQLNLQP